MVQTGTEERRRRFASEIVGLFENLLEEKEITIPSEDRLGYSDEARIYGCEYYDLEDSVYDALSEFESGVQ